MTEQEATDQLEDMVGIKNSFRLMRLWTSCNQSARPNNALRPSAAVDIFRKAARRDGYSEKATEFFIENMQ